MLALGLCVSFAQSLPQQSVNLMSVESPLYKELLPDAVTWRRAVVARDVGKVVAYIPAEFKPALLKAFRERFSNEYQQVFGPGRSSLRSELQVRSQLVMFEHSSESEPKPVAVTVCYTTAAERRMTWPAEDAALRESTIKSRIPCQIFVRDGEGWTTMIEALVQH